MKYTVLSAILGGSLSACLGVMGFGLLTTEFWIVLFIYSAQIVVTSLSVASVLLAPQPTQPAEGPKP